MSQAAVPPPIEDRQRRIALIDTEVAILEREIADRRPTMRRAATSCWRSARAPAEELAALRGALGAGEGARPPRSRETARRRSRIRRTADDKDAAARDELAAVTAQLRDAAGRTAADLSRWSMARRWPRSWRAGPASRPAACSRDEIRTVLQPEARRWSERVIGQPHALDAVAQAIRTIRAGLTDPRKPIGVFLMVGTSGVGKTETALTPRRAAVWRRAEPDRHQHERVQGGA